MNPNVAKLLAVVGPLLAGLLKQYKLKGYIDVVELADWLIANWDVLTLGLMVGWQFLKRKDDLTPSQVRQYAADEAAGKPVPKVP